MPILTVALPWIPDESYLDGLTVMRGSRDVLDYGDGIALEVRRVDPAAFHDFAELSRATRSGEGPGRVILVAGSVPVPWRPLLRREQISFLDASGVAEIHWPRLSVSAGAYTMAKRRRRDPVPLQKGHAVVIQELLIDTGGGGMPSISEIARGAGASLSTASRAISQLARQGLVSKVRSGRGLLVEVQDRMALTELLARRTAWPGTETTYGYLYGRNTWDVATRLSTLAEAARIDLAVTGRTGAAFLGVASTVAPVQVRCWVSMPGGTLTAMATALGLEPVPPEEANVAMSADRWRIGNHRAVYGSLGDEWWTTVSNPLRVWCDLRDEPRGTEFAAQLWERIV